MGIHESFLTPDCPAYSCMIPAKYFFTQATDLDNFVFLFVACFGFYKFETWVLKASSGAGIEYTPSHTWLCVFVKRRWPRFNVLSRCPHRLTVTHSSWIFGGCERLPCYLPDWDISCVYLPICMIGSSHVTDVFRLTPLKSRCKHVHIPFSISWQVFFFYVSMPLSSFPCKHARPTLGKASERVQPSCTSDFDSRTP